MSVTTMLPQDSTSWSLIRGAAEKLPAERERFCLRYEPVIRSYLAARWQLAPTSDRVRDACQEVFLTLFSPGGPLERMRKKRPKLFRAYLIGISRRVACGIERVDRRRQAAILRHGDEPQPSEATVSRILDQAWVARLTGEAWRLMREQAEGSPHNELRLTVLTLRYLDDLSLTDIAERLPELSMRQVYRLMATGRDHFRRSMQSVLASYHPELTHAELDRHCFKLLELL